MGVLRVSAKRESSVVSGFGTRVEVGRERTVGAERRDRVHGMEAKCG